MLVIKYISILLVFVVTFLIGYLLSKKYTNRVKELKELQIALELLENKIKYTYEPIKEIFLQIKQMLVGPISNIFDSIVNNLDNGNVEQAFSKTLTNVKTNLLKEDIEIIVNLSKVLGKTETEGQVNQIKLANSFIKTQIQKAEKEEEKNSKLYKTLGATVGLTFVVILI